MTQRTAELYPDPGALAARDRLEPSPGSAERARGAIKISVVIPVRNDAEHLRQCLEAVAASTYSNCECIVVDDGSTDDTPAVAGQFPVKLIRLPKNQGPSYARNCGAAAASGEILFFVDADVCIYPDTIARIARTFAERPETDALIGSYDDEPGDETFLSQYKNLFHHYVHQRGKERASTFWSGCGAIRRDLFLQYGGFDTAYRRPAIEDIDLGYRLRADNRTIVLEKGLQVKHLKRWTFWGLLKTDIFDRAIPWARLIFHYKNFPNDLNLHISQRISVALAFLLLLAAGSIAFYRGMPLTLALYGFILIVMSYMFYLMHASKRKPWVIAGAGALLFLTGLISKSYRDLPAISWLSLISFCLLPAALLTAMLSHRVRRFLTKHQAMCLSGFVAYLTALALFLAIYFHALLLLPFLALLAIVLINFHFYSFFVKKRNVFFALMIIPIHLFYYLYSGVSFAFGAVSYLIGEGLRRRRIDERLEER